MSTVWQTRHRLLLERFDDAVDQFCGQVRAEPELVEEQAVRLVAATVLLLQQHRLNNRGQCRFCGWTQRKWRMWRPRPRCTVFQTVDHTMSQGLEVVWWELLLASGRHLELAEVRDWLHPVPVSEQPAP